MVESKSFAPVGMETLDIPEAEYAVFRVAKGADVSALHENVKKTWRFIFNDWFDNSGYVLSITWGKKPISMFPSENADLKE